jgi:toxin ParE1/3/4
MAHRLAPEVVTELDEIWFYIARESRSTDIADRFVNFITDRFILIAGNAHIGRLREDLRPALRSFPVGQYLIFYHIVDIDTLITPRGPWASRFGSVVRSIGGEKNRVAARFAKPRGLQCFLLKRIASAVQTLSRPNVLARPGRRTR